MKQRAISKKDIDTAYNRSFRNRGWMKQFGPRGTKPRRKLNAAERQLLETMRSSAPNNADRIHFFDITIGKLIMVRGQNKRMEPGGRAFATLKKTYSETKSIELLKGMQAIPLNLALKFAFQAMPAFRGNKGKASRGRIERIVGGLFRENRISFRGNTRVSFSAEATERIEATLGKKDAKAFVKLFRKNLKDETGWARHYIVSFIDPTIVLNRWN